MELLSEVRNTGKEQDGEFSLGLGELMMSVQHRNEDFQEVLGYTGLKLCRVRSVLGCDGWYR